MKEKLKPRNPKIVNFILLLHLPQFLCQSIVINTIKLFQVHQSSRTSHIANHLSLYKVHGDQIEADTVEIKAMYQRLERVLHRDDDSLAEEFMNDSSADE